MTQVHTPQQFETFMSQLRKTNQTLGFFCDFDKISKNVEGIRLNLHMLNSLIGCDDLQSAIDAIWRCNKNAFKTLGIVAAIRDSGNREVLKPDGGFALLDTYFESARGVYDFLCGTGLADLLTSRKISNLVDYVFGIETGLDSNARKNRSGHLMETHVEEVFKRNGIKYEKEVLSSEWPPIAAVLGSDKKRFDFAVNTASTTFLVEVNFYSKGGSKLNEVARAYSEIGLKVNSVDGFEFVWITDGVGWLSAKNKLEEAYLAIPRIYNLTDLCDFTSAIVEHEQTASHH